MMIEPLRLNFKGLQNIWCVNMRCEIELDVDQF